MHRVLDLEGRLIGDARPALEPGEVLEALRLMKLSRAFDVRATILQRQGRLGTFSPVKGQEASVVGTAMTLDPGRDWVVPSYRELPAMVRQGYPLERMLASLMGKVVAGRIPDGVNVLPNQVALATQLQHAVGLAWGFKLQRKQNVVMAYCGDGATSEGDFHEACNLAGVHRVPIVFVIQNNQWAISTGVELQSAGELYRRAEGYGFPGRQVDGNDLLAVQEVAEEAVRRARDGEGPTLIECMTARLGFHNTTDNPRDYLPEGWLEKAEREEPIRRVEGYLANLGLWDEATRAAVEGEIAEQMDAAVDAAGALPAAKATEVFDNVYADPPRRVLRQREELLRLISG